MSNQTCDPNSTELHDKLNMHTVVSCVDRREFDWKSAIQVTMTDESYWIYCYKSLITLFDGSIRTCPNTLIRMGLTETFSLPNGLNFSGGSSDIEPIEMEDLNDDTISWRRMSLNLPNSFEEVPDTSLVETSPPPEDINTLTKEALNLPPEYLHWGPILLTILVLMMALIVLILLCIICYMKRRHIHALQAALYKDPEASVVFRKRVSPTESYEKYDIDSPDSQRQPPHPRLVEEYLEKRLSQIYPSPPNHEITPTGSNPRKALMPRNSFHP